MVIFHSYVKLPEGTLQEDHQQMLLVGGWAIPLKNMKVNWDDDIPNWMEKLKMFQTTNKCWDSTMIHYINKLVGDLSPMSIVLVLYTLVFVHQIM